MKADHFTMNYIQLAWLKKHHIQHVIIYFFYANVISKFLLKRNNLTAKSQKLAIHSLKNKDQCPITWDSKQYIETQLTQLNYAAKNEKLTSTIAMPISQNIPHFMAFLFKI